VTGLRPLQNTLNTAPMLCTNLLTFIRLSRLVLHRHQLPKNTNFHFGNILSSAVCSRFPCVFGKCTLAPGGGICRNATSELLHGSARGFTFHRANYRIQANNGVCGRSAALCSVFHGFLSALVDFLGVRSALNAKIQPSRCPKLDDVLSLNLSSSSTCIAIALFVSEYPKYLLKNVTFRDR